ncbi:DUF1289 domain-containing protein [Franzmannia qiaohouensis]|uniref:DUF1289 domain-containing protein n=1 Tax=Franzmannia qiaohouensis TaxID=1329370 RepID=A0ABU1HKD5_9GAMM|nr:DUF1289 domain-containing protein [Halomonas qiaohouensis]MDR5907065.1 DUF1289 domain-containing protein [Halomonas qiaohouensis]
MSAPRVSPCTKVCRIDERNGLCEGCGRTLDEIARWGSMNEAERASIWARLGLETHDRSG